MELEQTVQRGFEARQILSSPVFKEMVDSLKARYTSELIKSAESESLKREQLYIKMRVLDDLITEIGITEQSGHKAEKDLKVRKTRQSNKGVI